MSSGSAMRSTSSGRASAVRALRLNSTTMVSSSATSVSGAMRGTKRPWYQSLLTKRSSTLRVSSPAMHGMPR